MRAGLLAGFSKALVLTPLSLVATPVILANVGLADYGFWSTVTAFLAIAALSEGGLKTEISRRVSLAHGSNDAGQLQTLTNLASACTLGVGSLIALCGVLGAPVLVSAQFQNVRFQDTTYTILAQAAFVLLGCNVALQSVFAILNGVQRSDIEMWANVAGGALNYLTTILLVVNGVGIEALLYGAAAQFITTAAVGITYFRRLTNGLRLTPWIPRGAEPARLFYTSGLLLIMQLSTVIDYQWDKLVLSRIVSSEAAGAYDIGTSLVVQARSLVLIPCTLALVGLGHLATAPRTERTQFFDRMAATTLSIALPVFSALAVFAAPLTAVWLGEQYDAQIGDSIALLAIALYVNSLSAPQVIRLIAQKSHGTVAILASGNIVLNGMLSLMLTIQFGFNGALYGSIIANAVYSASVVVYSARRGESQKALQRHLLFALPITIAAAGVRVFELGFDSGALVILMAGAWAAVTAGIFIAAGQLPVKSLILTRQ